MLDAYSNTHLAATDCSELMMPTMDGSHLCCLGFWAACRRYDTVGTRLAPFSA